MGSSVEGLKLRRMRIRNEISFNRSTEERTEWAEDLEALREELRRVSKQIEEAEQQRVLQETLQLGCAKREGNPSPAAEGRAPVRAYSIEQGFGVCRDPR